ncbi:MAG TPA: DinB family protein [Chthonomonadales bacterium]|nr:DinB family protein [Chthonomonadales bacterium]
MFPAVVRSYLTTGLKGTPDVLDRLLAALSRDDPRWDFHPDPERFSLREVVAHLADWEPIHIMRIERIRDENEPDLPSIDENQLAAENDYAYQNAQESLARFRSGRSQLMHVVETLPEAAWGKFGIRQYVGRVSIDAMLALILGHDGYHTQQVAQWLDLASK